MRMLWWRRWGECPSGAKAPLLWEVLTYGLKPVPFKEALLWGRLMQGLKGVAF